MGTQNVSLEKGPSFVLEFFKSDDMERRYGATTVFLKIR